MFLLLIVASICEQVRYYPPHRHYARNSLWGKIKKTVKHITKGIGKGIGKVFKAAGKVVGHVVRPISRFIYHGSDSEFLLPCKIEKFDTTTITNDYVADDINEVLNSVIPDFSMNLEDIKDFFARAKYSKQSDKLFNRIDFDKLNDTEHRSAKLSKTIIKISKVNGNFAVKVRQASTIAAIHASTQQKKTRSHWGHTKTYTQLKWRALEPKEIDDILKACTNEISSIVEKYKKT